MSSTEVVSVRIEKYERSLLEAVAARRGYRWTSHLVRDLIREAIVEQYGEDALDET